MLAYFQRNRRGRISKYSHQIMTALDSFHLSLFVGVGMLATYLAFILVWRRWRRQYQLPASTSADQSSSSHIWGFVDFIERRAYCNLCSALVLDGWACDACGITAHRECITQANKSLKCKSLSLYPLPKDHSYTMEHHWVKGACAPEEVCSQCSEECFIEADLTDSLRCCWCQRVVHAHCLKTLPVNCDLGPHRVFIVPPYCVKLKKAGGKSLVLGSIHPPPYHPWHPLVVVANRKSGDNEGDLVLRTFRSVLNPLQVIDLDAVSPEAALQWCLLLPPTHLCRVLIGGGDGTVTWVLNAIDKLCIEPQPIISVLPLGTGNDLSRILGWGPGGSQDIDANKILENLASATVVKLDRWKVHIVGSRRHLHLHRPIKDLFMTNYISVGVDALVALKFHQTRDSKLYFSNRLLNKLLYVTFGTREVFERGCKDLHKKILVKLDGRTVSVPEIEAVVVLNIPSWGAGVRPWHMGPDGAIQPPQKFDDGLVEVIGLYSSFHIAQLQVGLSEPHRFGQARTVEIHLLDTLPMQVDGEPWIQSPGTISISFYNQCSLLSNIKPR